jgi:hypothetical protein
MDCIGIDEAFEAAKARKSTMNFETIRDALADTETSLEGAKEARVIAVKATEDARTMIERMNEQVILHLAKFPAGSKSAYCASQRVG